MPLMKIPLYLPTFLCKNVVSPSSTHHLTYTSSFACLLITSSSVTRTLHLSLSHQLQLFDMLGLKKSKYKKGFENKREEEIGWEVRPGGMLVQKRSDGVGASKPMVIIKISHGSHQYELKVPAQSTFGDVKRILASETGLEPNEQRLLFRGKEKEDEDWLHMVGVMDMSKVVLLEDPASRERKLKEWNMNNGISKACEAIMKVRVEVDKLTKKVAALESTVYNGARFLKEVLVLTELFMTELLKLDNVAAEGEAKELRRIEEHHYLLAPYTLGVSNAVNTLPNQGKY